jgi:hypothetical protein
MSLLLRGGFVLHSVHARDYVAHCLLSLLAMKFIEHLYYIKACLMFSCLLELREEIFKWAWFMGKRNGNILYFKMLLHVIF